MCRQANVRLGYLFSFVNVSHYVDHSFYNSNDIQMCLCVCECVCLCMCERNEVCVSVIEFLHVFTKFAPKILLYMCVCVFVCCAYAYIIHIVITYICTYNYNTFFSSHFVFFSLEIFINMHKVCLGEIVFLLFRFLFSFFL